jgi:5-(carboxyamino)imidazole ribonucleotide synthase
MSTLSKAVSPGSRLGILGGGQLGRMMAMAARVLGYRVSVLDPDPACAARGVVDDVVVARFDDEEAARELAARSDVVTIETERIAVSVLEAVSRHAPVRPGPHVLGIIQDRCRQKTWLVRNGFPVGPWHLVESAVELERAMRGFASKAFVKATRGGYDGRGQVEVGSPDQAASAWNALRAEAAVAEQAIDIAAELSVLVARRPSGEVQVFPVALNHHESRILKHSVIPAPVPSAWKQLASRMATDMVEALALEGLLTVELFVTRDGELLVNELAPRPHNTFHGTELGCATSQFEQAVRAVCDLPLGSTAVVRPVAIQNLLADTWSAGEPPFERALAIPGVRVHLYGKGELRAGRKMGHLSATGTTVATALDSVERAFHMLRSA